MAAPCQNLAAVPPEVRGHCWPALTHTVSALSLCPLPTPARSFLGLDPEQGRPHLTNVNTREQHLMAKGELVKGQKVCVCVLRVAVEGEPAEEEARLPLRLASAATAH